MPSFKGQRTTLSRSSRDIAAPKLDPGTTNYIRPVRKQGQETQNFLNHLAEFTGRKVVDEGLKKAAEKKVTLNAKAAVFGATGEVDQDLMISEPYYAQRVNATSGEADAKNLSLDMLEAAKEDMKRAETEGEQWDALSFHKEFTAEFNMSEAAKNLDYAAGAAPHLEAGRAALQQMQFQQEATLKDRQATESTLGDVYAMSRAGAFNYTLGKERALALGHTPNEWDKIAVEGVVAALDQAKDDFGLRAYDSIMKSFSPAQQAIYSTKLTAARDAAVARIKAAETNKMNARSEDKLREIVALETGIETGETSTGAIFQAFNRDDPLITKGEYETMTKKVIAYQNEQAEKALGVQVFMEALGNPELALTASDEDKKKIDAGWDDVMKNMSRDISSTLKQFTPDNSPANDQAMEQLLGQLDAYGTFYRKGGEAGLRMNWLEDTLGAAEDSGTANLHALSKLYTAVKNQYGDEALPKMSNSAVLTLEAYEHFRSDMGLTDEQARTYMDKKVHGQTIAQTRTVMGKDNLIKRFVRNTQASDFRNAGDMEDDILDLAAAHYRLNGDIGEALTFAKDRYAASHTEIDGRMVPVSKLPPTFTTEYEDSKLVWEQYLTDSNAISEGDETSLIPMDDNGSTGQFMIMNDTTGDLVHDPVKGQNAVVTADEIMSISTRINKDNEAAALAERQETALRENKRKAAARKRLDDAHDVLAEKVAREPVKDLWTGNYYKSRGGFFNDLFLIRESQRTDAEGNYLTDPPPKPEPEVKPEMTSTAEWIENAVENKHDVWAPPGTSNQTVDAETGASTPVRPPVPLSETVSPRAVKQIAEHEGFRPTVYLDTSRGKHPTIGFGINLDASQADEWFAQAGLDADDYRNGKALTKPEAQQLLVIGVNNAEADVKALVPNLDKHPEPVRRILLDMSFNLGKTRLQQFKKLLTAINKNPPDYDEAANQMVNSDWYGQVGRRSRALVRLMRSQATTS